MLDGPIKDFLPITPSPKPKDAPPIPKKPVDVFFNEVAANIQKVDYDILISGLPPRVKEIPPKDNKSALAFIMLQEARNIYEKSNSPVELFQANQRNRDNVANGAPPIQNGDRIHGMRIEFFKNAQYGLLAPEFYGGRTESYTDIYCSLYVSQITNIPENSLPEQIIKGTHTAIYGLKEGTVTLVFDKDLPSKNLRQGVVGGVKPNSVARAISVGESLTDVKSCVVSNAKDVIEMKKILASLKMYVPLYDGRGNKLFTHEDWLDAQKKI